MPFYKPVVSEKTRSESNGSHDNDVEYDYLVKIKLLGDSGVGKSALLSRFVDDTFTESLMSTMGVDFRLKQINVGDNRVKLQIWDTAGQDRFRAVSKYDRGQNAWVVVFDVTHQETFNNIKKWLEEIVCQKDFSGQPLIIVGNKVDLESERRVQSDEAFEFVEAWNAKPENNNKQIQGYIETSAKTSINVNALFEDTVTEYLKATEHDGEPPFKATSKTFTASKQELIQKLQSYIDRINTYHDNFSHGFWFLKKSRALNRQINYELAKELVEQLKTQSVGYVFANYEITRQDIIKKKKFDKNPDFVDRGINSEELNEVLDEGKELGKSIKP